MTNNGKTHVVKLLVTITSDEMDGSPIESAALFNELIYNCITENFAADIEIAAQDFYEKTW